MEIIKSYTAKNRMIYLKKQSDKLYRIIILVDGIEKFNVTRPTFEKATSLFSMAIEKTIENMMKVVV